MGSYRFYTTGDVEAFRAVGARFLQMPLTRVRPLSLDDAGRSRRPVSSRFLARAALYAALYAALTLAPGLNALAYGQVQFRLAGGAARLRLRRPGGRRRASRWGRPSAISAARCSLVDVVFGSLLTLVAAALMYRIGPRWSALVVPVVVNGLGVAAMLAAGARPAVLGERRLGGRRRGGRDGHRRRGAARARQAPRRIGSD